MRFKAIMHNAHRFFPVYPFYEAKTLWKGHSLLEMGVDCGVVREVAKCVQHVTYDIWSNKRIYILM